MPGGVGGKAREGLPIPIVGVTSKWLATVLGVLTPRNFCSALL
jgi:hypothetical protein